MNKELDIIKAIAIMLLPAVHIMEYITQWGNKGIVNLSYIIISLCAIGPIIFVLCLGLQMGSHRNYKSLLRNGVQFLILGVLLNIVRWLIPYTIEGIILEMDMPRIIMLCVKSDIYYFVGLFFILYGLFKKFKLKTSIILIISILMVIIGLLFIPEPQIENQIIAGIVGNFIYVDAKSCFPLLTWFIYPIIGIALNELLKNSKNKNKTYLIIFIVSIIVFILFIIVAYILNINIGMTLVPPFSEYRMTIFGVIASISLTLIVICLVYWLYNLIKNTKLMKNLSKISSRIIAFYFIQWIFIIWLKIIADITSPTCTLLHYWLITIIVTIGCIVLTIIYGDKLDILLNKCTSIITNKMFRKKKKVTK